MAASWCLTSTWRCYEGGVTTVFGTVAASSRDFMISAGTAAGVVSGAVAPSDPGDLTAPPARALAPSAGEYAIRGWPGR